MSFLGSSKKKNAFDVIMKTARKPGAFDLSLHDDPWNEVLAADDRPTTWDSLNHYHQEGHCEYYDPAFQHAMETISDSTYKNTPLDRDACEQSGQSQTDYFLSTFRTNDNFGDDNDTNMKFNEMEQLPPTATSPSAGDIDIMYRRISNRKQKREDGMETELSKLGIIPMEGGRFADDEYAAERPKKKQRRVFFDDHDNVEENQEILSQDFACHGEVQSLMEEFHRDLSRICGSAQKTLLDWYLKNREGRLINLEEIQIETDRVSCERSDLDDAPSLKKRCRRLKELRERSVSVLKMTDFEREELQKLSLKLIRGAKFHLSVQLRAYRPRITQVNDSMLRKGIFKATGNNAAFCATSQSLFNPYHVRSRKRCSIPGCFDRNYNCGCTVCDCAICEGPICHRHRAAHRMNCEKEQRENCSWKKYDESSDDADDDGMDYE